MIAVELVAGLVLLVVGAELLVRGAARLALGLGIPALVVGLTVVAFGTSAPELAVSVKSAWSGQSELALANAVGSNTFNILFILGLSAVVAPLAVSRTLLRRDLPVMSLVALIALLMAWNGSIGAVEAGALCLGLVGYTVWLLRQGSGRVPMRLMRTWLSWYTTPSLPGATSCWCWQVWCCWCWGRAGWCPVPWSWLRHWG